MKPTNGGETGARHREPWPDAAERCSAGAAGLTACLEVAARNRASAAGVRRTLRRSASAAYGRLPSKPGEPLVGRTQGPDSRLVLAKGLWSWHGLHRVPADEPFPEPESGVVGPEGGYAWWCEVLGRLVTTADPGDLTPPCQLTTCGTHILRWLDPKRTMAPAVGAAPRVHPSAGGDAAVETIDAENRLHRLPGCRNIDLPSWQLEPSTDRRLPAGRQERQTSPEPSAEAEVNRGFLGPRRKAGGNRARSCRWGRQGRVGQRKKRHPLSARGP